MTTKRLQAGIFSASGYMGGEALRVLLDHPEVEIAWATSRSPSPVEHHHPNLLGCGIELVHPDDAGDCDVAFLAVPTAASIESARKYLDEWIYGTEDHADYISKYKERFGDDLLESLRVKDLMVPEQPARYGWR